MPTPNYGIPYLVENQDQKHITINEAFDIIDSKLNPELNIESGDNVSIVSIVDPENDIINLEINVASTDRFIAGKAGTTGVVTLVEDAPVAIDASLGNHFRLTLTSNRTMGTPTNPLDGQKITFEVIQGGAGGYTLTFPTAGSGDFAFPAAFSSITLSTSVGAIDLIPAIYSSAKGRWLLASPAQGY